MRVLLTAGADPDLVDIRGTPPQVRREGVIRDQLVAFCVLRYHVNCTVLQRVVLVSDTTSHLTWITVARYIPPTLYFTLRAFDGDDEGLHGARIDLDSCRVLHSCCGDAPFFLLND